MKVPMGPPPPKTPINPSPNDTNTSAEPHTNPQNESQTNETETHVSESDSQNPNPNSTTKESPKISVPYEIPPWSESPRHQFFLEVLKDGAIIDQFDVYRKGAYMFGRIDLCDFVLEHPTISRFHAVLQFKKDGDAFLYDLGSTHGTYVNKSQVKKKVYTELHVGDVIRFGQSSRLYIFQGPSELMPQESDLKKLRNTRLREEMQDREASLLRARAEASLADGISWGMTEDAIEEVTEDDADEITWQTYKGQLTEKQEKTRDKIIKRTEKVANMKKEIDAIRAKDIAQGGLTQGQQTQIARNEQRMSQILEELENLEETLNESIQESIGARTGKVSYGKKKGTTDDGDEVPSDDDDEFYDRTKKRSAIQKTSERRSVETADTLLDKKEIIVKEMEGKINLLLTEKTKIALQIESNNESGDALDAYMTGLSSQLVVNTTLQLQKEISALQTELDRILYLLKIADPTGEATHRRDSKAKSEKSNQLETFTSAITKKPLVEQKKCPASQTVKDPSVKEESLPAVKTSEHAEEDKNISEGTESKTPLYPISKPRWLGATQDMEIKENRQQEAPLNVHEAADSFVDYRNRKEALVHVDDAKNATKEPMIEDAAPGLIIRKRKHEGKTIESEDNVPKVSTSLSAQAETEALDAVALLLKHKRGYFASEEVERDESLETQGRSQSRKDNSKPKRVLGPERPNFLNGSTDYDSWVPPQGQSGDGRTSLNDRFGY